MKRFISKTALASCVMFSVIMAWFLVMGYLFAGPSYGLNLTASLMAASLGMAVLQTLWFSEAVFKRLAYPARIAGFGACGLPVIGACAWLGRWMPSEVGPGGAAAFVVAYLLILAATSAAYALYYKKAAGSYDEALARYRRENPHT